ncbi:MAG TPA: OmpA family protein [Xanthomonadaceae bacterium]|nr:OmpA family protein [Xanthomonadaceae bacterium]
MNASFAYFRPGLLAALLVSVLAACATLPPPTSELAAAQQAVARAGQADADQYASAAIARARDELSRAQAAMAAGRDADARGLANLAAADADLAHARSRAASLVADVRQREAEIAGLRQRLQLPADEAPGEALVAELADAAGGEDTAAVPADPAALAGRLQAMDADPRFAGAAAYERLRAQQALDAATAARGKARDAALAVAARRVATAGLAARGELVAGQLGMLDRTRTELLLEASRQDAERARQEAERLRLQAQIQAEEAARLRASVDAEASARQQAEEVLGDVASAQAAKLAAAREKEAALARQEAELLAGGKLPPSRSAAGGEVFTLAGDAFASGSARLSGGASASLRALAAYLGQSKAAIRVDAYTDSQGEEDANLALSRRRAEAVRQALVAGGVAAGRIQAEGRGEADPVADNTTAIGRARNRRVEIAVSQK